MILPLELLGRIEAHQGNFAAARIFYEEGLAIASVLDDYWLCASCLEGLASVVAAQGAPAWAARLWGTAESLRGRCGIPLTPVERDDYKPAVAAVNACANLALFQLFGEAARKRHPFLVHETLDRRPTGVLRKV